MTATTIAAYFTAIPPIMIAVFGALLYIRVMNGRYHLAMLPDAGLVALYLWRPSMLAWCLFLIVARNVPTFAAIVAQTFKLDTWEGWSVAVVLFALPGLRAFATAQDVPHALPAPITGPTVALAAPPAIPPLRPAQWLGAVNDDATAPHLGVVGATRLGKTTFVLAALGRRAGRVVITTPKSQDVDPWAGAYASRLRFDLDKRAIDWTPIGSAIDGVHYEMLQRSATNKARDAETINLVVDELSTTLANCEPRIKRQILELLNMGAGAGIRLVLIDPEVNARAWGVEGRRDILGNLVFARVDPGRRWALGRLDPNGRLVDPQPLDTAPLLALAGEARLSGREWTGGSLSVPPPLPVLASQTDRQTQTDVQTDAEQRILKYVAWRRAGITRDQARLIRQGSGDGLDGNEWADAGKRIGASTP